MVKLPRQSKREIDKIRKEFDNDFWFIGKDEDLKQKRNIQRYLNGDDYEDELTDEELIENGFI
jgi:hypothetical protein